MEGYAFPVTPVVSVVRRNDGTFYAREEPSGKNLGPVPKLLGEAIISKEMEALPVLVAGEVYSNKATRLNTRSLLGSYVDSPMKVTPQESLSPKSKIRERILKLLETKGPLTDRELYVALATEDKKLCPQTVRRHRLGLEDMKKIVPAGKAGSALRWGIRSGKWPSA